ncbi:aminodeoxychorismate/anthranilate synthase component II [bacterium]|nr:aminodeoxychorismate/anthranilate synthase component II [bacterium]
MIFILDNYDSFTFNLVQAVNRLGVETVTARNDEITAAEVLELGPSGIILSPGPGRPENAGNMPKILSAALDKVPILGVCLGHQMIGLLLGAQVVAASNIVHGKSTRIHHDGLGVFHGLPNPFSAGRYHSLIVSPEALPEDLTISARTDGGEIMGLRHRRLPVEGVQFHPESILTPEGDLLLLNFVRLTSGCV